MIPVWLVSVLHVISVVSAATILVWLGVAAAANRHNRPDS
jgi:uncharacterized membrane protein